MPCEVCIPNLHYQCCVSIQPGNSKHLTTPTLNIFSNPSTAVYIYSMSHVWYRRDHNMNYQLSPTSSSIEDCLHSTQLFGDIVQSLQEGYIINMVAARTTNWYRYSQMSSFCSMLYVTVRIILKTGRALFIQSILKVFLPTICKSSQIYYLHLSIIHRWLKIHSILGKTVCKTNHIISVYNMLNSSQLFIIARTLK